MWRMLQMDSPQDLVVGTGETCSVGEFVEAAFGYAGLDWRDYVEVDRRYCRPTEVPLLRADPSEAKRRLGWEARIGFSELVRIMVDADREAAGLPTPGEGKRCLTDRRVNWLERP